MKNEHAACIILAEHYKNYNDLVAPSEMASMIGVEKGHQFKNRRIALAQMIRKSFDSKSEESDGKKWPRYPISSWALLMSDTDRRRGLGYLIENDKLPSGYMLEADQANLKAIFEFLKSSLQGVIDANAQATADHLRGKLKLLLNNIPQTTAEVVLEMLGEAIEKKDLMLVHRSFLDEIKSVIAKANPPKTALILRPTPFHLQLYKKFQSLLLYPLTYFRPRLIILTFFLVTIVSICFGFGIIYSKPGSFQIYKEKGLNQAISYLAERQVKSDKNIDHRDYRLIQEAFFDFQSGNSSVAYDKCIKILDNPSSKYRPDCFHLLGKIRHQDGDFKSANDYFERAYIGYTQVNRINDSYISLVYSALSFLSSRDLNSATEKLEQASYINSNSIGLSSQAFHSYVQGLGWIYLGEYKDAVLSLTAALELYSKDRDEMGICQSKIALSLANTMSRDCSLGYEFAVNASKMIQKMGSRKLFIYNRLNYLAVNICSGSGMDSDIQLILDYLKDVDDAILKGYLEILTGETYER